MQAPWPRPVAETTGTSHSATMAGPGRSPGWRTVDGRATVADRFAHEEKAGKEVARRDYLTGDELGRILDDEIPVKVWREKRGLTQRELAEQAAVGPSYLAEIETGKKPGSAAALRKLSRVLAIPMENLASWPG